MNFQPVRPKRTAEKAPLGNMQISGYAFEHLEIDVLGADLQRSKRGNKYVSTLSCRTAGWPFAIPMRNVRSKTITDNLSELFCSIGIPKTLVLDNMPSFRSESFAKWARDLGIKLNFSAPNHPISHAHIEKTCDFPNAKDVYP